MPLPFSKTTASIWNGQVVDDSPGLMTPRKRFSVAENRIYPLAFEGT